MSTYLCTRHPLQELSLERQIAANSPPKWNCHPVILTLLNRNYSPSCWGCKRPSLTSLHQPLYVVTCRQPLALLSVCLSNPYNYPARSSLLLNSLLLRAPTFSVFPPNYHTMPRLIFKEKWSHHLLAQQSHKTPFRLLNEVQISWFHTSGLVTIQFSTYLSILTVTLQYSCHNPHKMEPSYPVLSTTLPFFMSILS